MKLRPVQAAIVTAIVLSSGCASVNYGPLQVRTFGTDVAFDDASWIKRLPDGTVEAVTVKGARKDGSTSTHSTANVAAAIVGALVGSPAGVPGSAAGAGIASAVAELIQQHGDSPAPAVSAPVSSPDLSTQHSELSTSSSALVDPNPAKYTQGYMDANGRWEEVGIESERKIMVRVCFWRPSANGWWLLSSLVMDRVQVNAGQISLQDFVQDGLAYHVIGWRATEPVGSDRSVQIPGNSAPYSGRIYCLVECRRAP